MKKYVFISLLAFAINFFVVIPVSQAADMSSYFVPGVTPSTTGGGSYKILVRAYDGYVGSPPACPAGYVRVHTWFTWAWFNKWPFYNVHSLCEG